MSESSDLNASQELHSKPLWVCKLEEKNTAWTVGEKRELRCQGEEIKNFKTLPKIVFPKEESSLKYSLHILEIKKDLSEVQLKKTHLNKASFIVTSYKPGEHAASFFIASQNSQVKILNPLSWKVENTLKNQMGNVKPHGPMGPFLLAWPIEFKILGSLIAFLIFCLFTFKIYKFFLRRYWKKKSLKLLTPSSPYLELNKEIRSLLKKHPISSKTNHFKIKNQPLARQDQQSKEKNNEFEIRRNYIKGLEESFQLYLTRVFLIPAHKLKIHSLIKEIKFKRKSSTFKKENPKFKTFNLKAKDFKSLKKELRFLMNELKKAKQKENKLKITDCEHLTQWVRRWSEKMNPNQFKKTK